MFVEYSALGAGSLLAGMLLDACAESLPDDVEYALKEVDRGAPDPDRIAALPANLSDLVELSGCTRASREALEEAYAQMKRDARHRVGAPKFVPVMKGGTLSRDDDVEVTLRRQKTSYRGVELPYWTPLENYLPEGSESIRFVVLAEVWETFDDLRQLLTKARSLGYSEFGLIVVDEGHYRVLPVAPGDLDGTSEFPLRILEVGFLFAHSLPALPASAQRQMSVDSDIDPRIDVQLKRPNAPLRDRKRWDWDALEAETVKRLGTLKQRPEASVWAEDDAIIGDVIAAVQILRGPKCEADGGPNCRIVELKWRL